MCVIRPEHEAAFHAALGARLGQYLQLTYAYQTPETALPPGFQPPAGRVKPWGTGHAALSAAPWLDAPFAVINADDFYGPDSFRAIYDFLAAPRPAGSYAMVGFELANCLTENGSVSRGVCRVDGQGRLLDITERTKIFGPAQAPKYTEDGGLTYTGLDPRTLTSLNLWGFQPDFLTHLQQGFHRFLARELPANPLKGEFYLPFAVNDCLSRGQARVQVLPTREKWYGVTYKEDLDQVRQALALMTAQGAYPADF